MTPGPQVCVPVGTREPTGLSFSKRFQTLRGVRACVHACTCAYNLPKYSLKIKKDVFVFGCGTVGVGDVCMLVQGGSEVNTGWVDLETWSDFIGGLSVESSLSSPSKNIRNENKPKNISEKATTNMLGNNLCSVDCFFLFILVPQ